MLDRIYGFVALSRRRWIERHAELRRWLERPVISIGNLTVGGTGKTPVVGHVARWLIERGERPAILSRGYARRRRLDGVTVVSDGRNVVAGIDEAGDEPLMLARQVPGAAICVADDRYLAGVLAERRLGCTVHVLDDGFQHFGVHRDLDVLVSAAGELADARVLPLGRLREPLEVAARAHLLIVAGADEQEARAEAWNLGIGESAGMKRTLGDGYLVPARTRIDVAVSGVRDGAAPGENVDRGLASARAQSYGDVVAVAGIANPSRFFEALDAANWSVARALAFPDHHAFTSSDVRRIAAAARATRAEIVLTTEKDAVRFERCGPLPFTLAPVPLHLVFDRWETVEGAMLAAIDRARARRQPLWAVDGAGR